LVRSPGRRTRRCSSSWASERSNISFLLGAITLPNPKSFAREFVETSARNRTAEGKETERVENRKERFILVFQELTQAQAANILSEYQLGEVRSFQVTEANLTIAATDVLVDVSPREYQPGRGYRENLSLILTEIS
jgi:hypothetical protein